MAARPGDATPCTPTRVRVDPNPRHTTLGISRPAATAVQDPCPPPYSAPVASARHRTQQSRATLTRQRPTQLPDPRAQWRTSPRARSDERERSERAAAPRQQAAVPLHRRLAIRRRRSLTRHLQTQLDRTRTRTRLPRPARRPRRPRQAVRRLHRFRDASRVCARKVRRQHTRRCEHRTAAPRAAGRHAEPRPHGGAPRGKALTRRRDHREHHRVATPPGRRTRPCQGRRFPVPGPGCPSSSHDQ